MDKPGWKTSEFWLTLLAVVSGVFAGSGILPETHAAVKIAGLVVSVLAALGYQISRTSAKKNTEQPQITFKAIEKVPANESTTSDR